MGTIFALHVAIVITMLSKQKPATMIDNLISIYATVYKRKLGKNLEMTDNMTL